MILNQHKINIKSSILTFSLKVMRKLVGLMSSGRVFHARGPATEKVLSETRSRFLRSFFGNFSSVTTALKMSPVLMLFK